LKAPSPATALSSGLFALAACAACAATATVPSGHTGPAVAEGSAGPARFVPALYEGFDAGRALADAAYLDGWYRTPGAEGYDLSLERLEQRLREAGFGAHPRLELTVLETEMEDPAWTPIRGRIWLQGEDGAVTVLHSFEHPADRDRVMLPMHCPSGDAIGKPVFGLEDVQPGSILVIEAPANFRVLRRAARLGAQAIVSSALFHFTVDPTGRERHRDAIKFAKVPVGTEIPVVQISPASHERIREAARRDSRVLLAVRVETRSAPAVLRTLVATIEGSADGSGLAGDAVGIASHVQEPGAGDNASGCAGLVEGACALARLLQGGELEWPARSIAFVWGDEFRQSAQWLDHTKKNVVAGISADMLGQSPQETGAVARVERSQDPGALLPLAPDEHTPWGAKRVEESDLVPNGVALVARVALHDVARHVGGWKTAENPWEGGSDHDEFLQRGIPAVLLWHFTDFTYHTSLDRMEMLDAEELRRSCVTVLATALALADPGPTDLERYLASNELERELRVAAAEEAGQNEIADRWEAWCDGAAAWLREVCSSD